MKKQLLIIIATLAVSACSTLHEPLEKSKPIESIRLSGDFSEVAHCFENSLRARDPAGHYEFVSEGAEGVLEGNGEWEVIFRQETPTSLRAAIKTELNNAGQPKRPTGLMLLITTCAAGPS
jgi:hypothetical protein